MINNNEDYIILAKYELSDIYYIISTLARPELIPQQTANMLEFIEKKLYEHGEKKS